MMEPSVQCGVQCRDVDVGVRARQLTDEKVDGPSAKHPVRNHLLREDLIEFGESGELRVDSRSGRHGRDGCEPPNA